MVAKKGLITTYLNEENKLLFELSQELLEKDLLVVTRFAQLPPTILPISMQDQKQRNR